MLRISDEAPRVLPSHGHRRGEGREHCEVDARSGRCANGVCKNGGTCVNLLIGGFHCVCPPGEYERPYCEVTTRSFPPRSFVTFRGLRQRFHFTVSLTSEVCVLRVWPLTVECGGSLL
ncbi:Cadherin EGF LAG seven-pass G-type receptor 1 [Plecturocebus cupreus]